MENDTTANLKAARAEASRLYREWPVLVKTIVQIEDNVDKLRVITNALVNALGLIPITDEAGSLTTITDLQARMDAIEAETRGDYGLPAKSAIKALNDRLTALECIPVLHEGFVSTTTKPSFKLVTDPATDALVRGAVSSSKIAKGAVTAPKADNAISSAKASDGTTDFHAAILAETVDSVRDPLLRCIKELETENALLNDKIKDQSETIKAILSDYAELKASVQS